MNNIFFEPSFERNDYVKIKEHTIEIKCDENKECVKKKIIFHKNLKNKNYRIIIHFDIEEEILNKIEFFEFSLYKENKKIKEMEKKINLFFFIFSITIFITFLINFLKTKKKERTFLHEKIMFLSISLLLYNFPLFLLNLIKIEKFEIMLKNIYKIQLLILFLYTWLIFFKIIKDKKKKKMNFYYGFKIKILCLCIFIFSLIFLNFFFFEDIHFNYFLERKNNYNIFVLILFMILIILGVLYVFLFIFYILKIKKKINLNSRNHFFLIFSIFGFIFIFLYFLRIACGQYNRSLFIFESDSDFFINFYIFILQICWSFKNEYSFVNDNKELAKFNKNDKKKLKENEEEKSKKNLYIEKNENIFSEFKITDETI